MENLKLFLVDDDPFSVNIFSKYLENLGYTEIETFNNGTDCLNRLHEKPDVILLDHEMSILNGFEVMQKIKRYDPNVFVVMVSGQKAIATAVESLKFGAFDYIEKGNDEESRLEEVLKRIHLTRQYLAEQNKSLFKRILSHI